MALIMHALLLLASIVILGAIWGLLTIAAIRGVVSDVARKWFRVIAVMVVMLFQLMAFQIALGRGIPYNFDGVL